VIETTLDDGTAVRLRRLGPDDRDGLAEGYRLLSPDSRYQRFWVRTGETIGEGMLDRILGNDPANHAVWAVLDPAREYPGVGAGSWWRSGEDPDEAEFSCTVLDADQRRGVGTLLLAAAWVDAMAAGVRRFVGYTMPENVTAVRWMRDTGAAAEWDGYKVIFRWNLDDLESIPPTTPGVALAGRLAELAGRVAAVDGG
jgi:acetyltransferase